MTPHSLRTHDIISATFCATLLPSGIQLKWHRDPVAGPICVYIWGVLCPSIEPLIWVRTFQRETPPPKSHYSFWPPSKTPECHILLWIIWFGGEKASCRAEAIVRSNKDAVDMDRAPSVLDGSSPLLRLNFLFLRWPKELGTMKW